MTNHAVKNGLYMGLASILYTFAVYLIMPDLLFKASINWIPGLLISVIFMYLACVAERNDNNGSLNFGEAFKTAFIAVAIGSLISMIAGYFLYNFIDPSLIDRAVEQQVEVSRSMAEKMGANEETIAQMEEDMANSGNPMSFSNIMIGYFFMLILSSIIAAIVAAITKRNTGA